MILVDSSVWIDFFRGAPTPQCDKLEELLGDTVVAIGDLALTEVLQGFSRETDYRQALDLLTGLTIVEIGGRAIALAAARNYRTLRLIGVTVRKTIDTLIATRCIEDGYALLHSDRDFNPFTEYLGLRSAMESA